MTYLIQCKACKTHLDSFMEYFHDWSKNEDEEEWKKRYDSYDWSNKKSTDTFDKDTVKKKIKSLAADMLALKAEITKVMTPLNQLRAALYKLNVIDEEENDTLMNLEILIKKKSTDYQAKVDAFQKQIDDLKLLLELHESKETTTTDDDDGDDQNEEGDSTCPHDVQDMTNSTDEDTFVRACHVKPATIIYDKCPDPAVWIRKDSIPCWGCNV